MRVRMAAAAAALLICAVSLFAGDADDVLMKRTRLDGSGNPWLAADLGIRGGRIVDMGRLGGAAARPRDRRPRTHRLARLHRRALARVAGSRGQPQSASAGRAGDHDRSDQPRWRHRGPRTERAGFEQRGVGVNVALYVPHGSIRREVLGMADRAPNAQELERMAQLARRGMEAGGIGLSSGLLRLAVATTEEVIARENRRRARRRAESHIRDEADYSVGVIAAVQEVIRISEEGHLPGIVAHMKALGPASRGLSMALVERSNKRADRGVEVYADQYPHDASGTGIVAR